LLNLAKDINLSTDSFQVGLLSSSYVPDNANDAVLADITNEISGNGYARQTVSNVSLTLNAGVVTFDFDDVVFTASGGSIQARWFFVFDNTVTTPNKPLVGYGLLNDNVLDVVVTPGNELTLEINTSGFLNISEV
jgi:hypothetical protein